MTASPPINNTCNFGIDIPTKEELIINKIPDKELTTFFGCEKVKYLDLDLLLKLFQIILINAQCV